MNPLRWLFGGRPPREGWRAAPCLAGLGDRDLDRLEPHVRDRRLAAGDVLVVEGDAATELFVVAEGELEIARTGDEAVTLATVERGDVIGEVASFDRGARSATARARSDAVVHAIPYACLDGANAVLSIEGRVDVLRRLGADLAARVRAGGAASALAYRRGVAMGEFLVAVMTLQCLYTITVTALPFLDGILPASTSYVSVPLQLVFGAGAVAFIVRTRLPLATFGLGARDLAGSLALGIGATLPFFGVATLLKWLAVTVKGSGVAVVERPDIASVAADPRTRVLFVVYAVSCIVQEVIVRSAIQSSLHMFVTGPRARLRTIGVSALVFATNHLHISPLFAAASLLPGLLWGWMFERQRNVAGIVLSHVAIGAFVFFVLGIYTG